MNDYIGLPDKCQGTIPHKKAPNGYIAGRYTVNEWGLSCLREPEAKLLDLQRLHKVDDILKRLALLPAF